MAPCGPDNVPVTLPALSVNSAVIGMSPICVFRTASQLPFNLLAVVDDAGAVVDAAVVAVVVDAVDADSAGARLADQSPCARPPKSAMPAIFSPSSLPVSVISIVVP